MCQYLNKIDIITCSIVIHFVAVIVVGGVKMIKC